MHCREYFYGFPCTPKQVVFCLPIESAMENIVPHRFLDICNALRVRFACRFGNQFAVVAHFVAPVVCFDEWIIKQLFLLCKHYCKIYLYKVYCIIDNHRNDNVYG